MTNRFDRNVSIPSPAKSVLVICSARASCAFIQLSTGAMNSGNIICLFSKAVSVIAGDIRNMLTSASSRIFGIHFTLYTKIGGRVRTAQPGYRQCREQESPDG